MARLAKRRPYHKIEILGDTYYVQFSFIEHMGKTECAIFDDCKKCITKASVTYKEPDEFSRHLGEQEAFKAAMDKHMDSIERMVQSFVKRTYKEMAHVEEALTYKVFKKTPVELEHSTSLHFEE